MNIRAKTTRAKDAACAHAVSSPSSRQSNAKPIPPINEPSGSYFIPNVKWEVSNGTAANTSMIAAAADMTKGLNLLFMAILPLGEVSVEVHSGYSSEACEGLLYPVIALRTPSYVHALPIVPRRNDGIAIALQAAEDCRGNGGGCSPPGYRLWKSPHIYAIMVGICATGAKNSPLSIRES